MILGINWGGRKPGNEINTAPDAETGGDVSVPKAVPQPELILKNPTDEQFEQPAESEGELINYPNYLGATGPGVGPKVEGLPENDEDAIKAREKAAAEALIAEKKQQLLDALQNADNIKITVGSASFDLSKIKSIEAITGENQ